MTSGRPRKTVSRVGSARRLGARAARGLLYGTGVALAMTVIGPAGVAESATPGLAITSPPSGSVTSSQMPSFSGTTNEPFDEEATETFEPVVLNIYNAEGARIQSLRTPMFIGRVWVLTAETLAPGTYTARAEQAGEQESQPVTFTVDTTPPDVTLTYPTNGSATSSGSQRVEGAAGTAQGDLSTVTIELFSGSTTESPAGLETLSVPASGGRWSATFGGLSQGTYTVRAEQADDVGNVGRSAPATFTVRAPGSASAGAPSASFRWFPTTPRTGETVSLVSNSTDITSPITGLAWAFGTNGAFQAGGPVLTTAFPTPGAHVVRLRVTAANGASNFASETISVISRSLTLMQPFPIVRIVGSKTSLGVHLNLLTVQAPVGARVTVTCQGRGCPRRSEGHLARASRKAPGASTVTLGFRAFERSLRAGVTLKVLVSKPGEIGKYTRITIRRHRLPARVDSCLLPNETYPVACPT
jgi:hypothetical protein